MNALVVYFSAESGRTANAAKALASAIGGDLFEIKPEKPYTASDLNYMNPLARCNREHIAKKKVPVDSRKVGNFEQYDTVLIGFPIWYGCAPNVVNSFCDAYDFRGKNVALFATSGGSGIGKSAEKLQPYVKGTKIAGARMMGGMDAKTMKEWVESL